MAIPESQLEIWANQGASTTAKSTSDSIKNALKSNYNWPNNIDFEVYLQGSYKNDTNIRGNSDVDVVVQLNSTFYNNLTVDQQRNLKLTIAPYQLSNFKSDVLRVLKDYYGENQTVEGNKAIKIMANSGRLSADVVVCSQYRKYRTLSIDDYIAGMCFWTKNENRQVINYPKIHYDNGVSKHQNSNKWFKPTVRLFKNCRENIAGDNTPSYFVECMLYNAPISKFGSNYQDTFCSIVNWLNENSLDNFICQNGQLNLFGPSKEQWNINEIKSFINNLIALWNNW